jgi:hypothetical protein
VLAVWTGSGKVSVDLAITGDLPATINGTKGRCGTITCS